MATTGSAVRPLRVLVYPHAMEIGGSQLNAVELAAEIQRRGHEVFVYSEDGPLVEKVEDLGLTHLRRHPARRRPSLARARHLAGIAGEHGIDVLHGYEWPPIMECWAATALPHPARAVGTVMSMAVAPFMPGRVPLIVGTQRIRTTVHDRRGPTIVIEPPVDVEANSPGPHAEQFMRCWSLAASDLHVVVVSRLAVELKLEGVLTTIRAIRVLADELPVHLTVVGDGPAAAVVREAVDDANAGLARPVVTMTGEVPDPRGAYDAADVVVGMGGSALRSLAFAKPLVVQGERGFFTLLTPETLGTFLQRGFYGIGDRSAEDAVRHLVGVLRSVLADPGGRGELGRWGRELVRERFSLATAATSLEQIYRGALGRPRSTAAWLADGVSSAPGLTRYKLGRVVDRSRGVVVRDDFNSRPA